MEVSGEIKGAVRLSIIIPAFDELPNLRELIPRIHTTIEELPNFMTEILVVLPTIATALEEEEIGVLGARVVIREPGDSFGDAIRCGISSLSAESRYVIVMDADGSHDPSTIPRLLSARHGAHVVVASRYTPGGTTDNSIILRAMSRVLNFSFSVVLGIQCRDVSTNYKLYIRSDLDQLKLSCMDFDIVEEILYGIKSLHEKAFVVREVPDHFYARNHGVTKRRLGLFIASYLSTLVRLRWQNRGHRK